MRYITQFSAVLLALWLDTTLAGAETALVGTNLYGPKTLETWGWLVAQEREIAGIEINPAELHAFLDGAGAALKSLPPPFALEKIFQDVQALARERRKPLVLAARQKNSAEAAVFFGSFSKKTNITHLPDGLCYQIIKPGAGPFPRPQQTVNVHYTGRLIDNTEFLQVGPADLILVSNHVSRGLFEGIQKLNAGGHIKIFIPPALAETDAEKMGTPPGAAMIFDVDLLAVKDTAPSDLADALVPPAPELPDVPLSGNFTASQIIQAWGWNIAQQSRATTFHLTPDETAAFLKGLSNGVQGRPPPPDLEKIYPAVEAFVADRREKARLEFKQKQSDQNASFFAALKLNTNVIFLPDGLAYEIVQPGRGAFPKPKQVAKVNYTGRLINGKIFDGTDPSLGSLDVDPSQVIPGWGEGIQKINPGGKIRLYIPPALAYRDAATGGIPPYSTLIFDIELLELASPSAP